jgi:hypothetical protein
LSMFLLSFIFCGDSIWSFRVEAGLCRFVIVCLYICATERNKQKSITFLYITTSRCPICLKEGPCFIYINKTNIHHLNSQLLSMFLLSFIFCGDSIWSFRVEAGLCRFVIVCLYICLASYQEGMLVNI